ncbi:MAG TPA: hypothetical protein VLJ10_02795 [Candidatus Bathyarchaeia archaeon]|nr:hypothetical protein [Candidatus Bathyarchaeia archaeon]
MNIVLLTFMVFVLCMVGLALSVFFKRQPLQKRCAADPLKPCTCSHEAGEGSARGNQN